MICLKKWIAFILVFVLCFSVSLEYHCAAYFETDPDSAAEELFELGLFQGTGTDEDGNPVFELNREPTRFEAVTMLVRLLGKEETAKSIPYSAPFTDIPDWAKPYVGFAYSCGLTKGTSTTSFSGDEPVSAAQYLTFVLRALGYDSDKDFVWDESFILSDQLGITNGQYSTSLKFTRGDVALTSRNALYTKLKGETQTLKEHIFGSQFIERDLSNSWFEIHFIDVGEADAALVLCDGHAMMIDGGNPSASSLIYSYLRDREISHLDYVICTHPHEDHVGGLAGALNYATTGVAYCPVDSYDTRAFASFIKYLEKQGVTITIPSAGDGFDLGNASVQIVGPIDVHDGSNNSSIVLRIEYGNTSFLFTGDAEREEELSILEKGYNVKSTLLKVGHHGSSSSSSYPFLYEVEAQYAVISVGENQYGHPTEDTLSKLHDADMFVYRTDYDGTIICKSDGQELTFFTSKERRDLSGTRMVDENNDVSDKNPDKRQEYVLNTNSHKFHYSDCTSVSKMSEKNKLVFVGTRDAIIAMNYSPCGVCKP